MKYKTFQDYWDRQIKRLRDTWCDSQMNYLFDECEKSFNSAREKCDCEEFQSCEKCAKKTEWKPISELKSNLTLYWIADKDNNTGEGYLKDDKIIIFSEGKIGIPTMFTEIKPPETP